MPLVLDMCCGSRAFWFDKDDDRAIFVDIRNCVMPRKHNDLPRAPVVVKPDIQCTFTSLPFKSGCFDMVVFDPPHREKLGEDTNLGKYYGRLFGHWECDIEEGFKEAFRVLRPGGTLVFKWCSVEIPVSRVSTGG